MYIYTIKNLKRKYILFFCSHITPPILIVHPINLGSQMGIIGNKMMMKIVRKSKTTNGNAACMISFIVVSGGAVPFMTKSKRPNGGLFTPVSIVSSADDALPVLCLVFRDSFFPRLKSRLFKVMFPYNNFIQKLLPSAVAHTPPGRNRLISCRHTHCAHR